MKKRLWPLILAIVLIVVLGMTFLSACATAATPPGDPAVISTDTLNTALQTLMTAVVIPAIIILGKAGFDWLKTKTTNAKLQSYVDRANEAVSMAVAEVMQTFVTTLKSNGAWSEDNAKQAFQQARDKAILLMGVAAYKALPQIFDDAQVWLTSRIEATILQLKTCTPAAAPVPAGG